jgi:hypothetical protein
MPGLPYIKFIYILSLLLDKINKKILCFILVPGYKKKIHFFFKAVPHTPFGGRGGAPLRSAELWVIKKNIFFFISNFVRRSSARENYNIKGAYRQETSSADDGSSETTRNITYNFDEYSFLIPQQKKKINRQFLE